MILILDYGSQYSELIARRVREANVYSELLPFTTTVAQIKEKAPSGIILSGGPHSIFQKGAPNAEKELFELGIPVLGICYGLQLTTHVLGGTVEEGEKHEYGPATLHVDDNSSLLEGLSIESPVWMSHGDSVTKLAPGFTVLGHTDTCPYAAIQHKEKEIYGIQFHPEVIHTQEGTRLLQNFFFNICNASADWTPRAFVDESIRQIQETVGDQHVLCALSGGVDSSVVAALMQRAIGQQLTCMFIDQGFMRKNEAENIKALFKNQWKVQLIYVDARQRFFDAVKGITDPEIKRKKIGNMFIEVFEEESSKLKNKFTFLAQGTLYPDIIESAAVGVSGAAVTIKTHHNVGGLPDDMPFEVIEPIKTLFKDEGRKVGLELGLSEEMVYRHPFPGPGLAIRILGEVTPERVEVLQNADAIVLEEIKAANYYRRCWQAFAVLLPVKSVGVMGDKRSYQDVLAIRAVDSVDAMTAQWSKLPYDLLDRISTRLLNEVSGINRVVYDISNKPPATIEWE